MWTIDPDAWITGAEAARLARVSRQLVRRWNELGHLDRIDGKYRAKQVLEVEAEMRKRSGRMVRCA